MNAGIQLYAAGSQNANASAALLHEPVRSDATGHFAVTEHYVCPAAMSHVYLVAKIDAPSGEAASDHPTAATLMAPLGRCQDTVGSPDVDLDELTTVASASLLAPFMQSMTVMSESADGDQSVENAFNSAKALVSLARVANADPSSPQGRVEDVQKVTTLAAIFAECLVPAAGQAGACSRLLVETVPPGQSADGDAANAIVEIAKNPTRNVDRIYSLLPAAPVYRPVLPAAPLDWKIGPEEVPSEPTFTPVPGSYAGEQTITLSESSPAIPMYYNVDGTWERYTGAITLSTSHVVQAIAVAAHGLSPIVTGAYTIAAPSLTMRATPVVVGQVASGTLTLAGPAPQGGVTVRLATSDASVATVAPTTLTIAAGQTSGAFTYTGVATGLVELRASAPGFTSGSAQVQVSAQRLTVIGQPGNSAAGAMLSPIPAFAVQDSSGAIVPAAKGSVSIRLAPNKFGGVLSGNTTVDLVNGVASFPGLSILSPGAGYALSASMEGAVSVATAPFDNLGSLAVSGLPDTMVFGQIAHGTVTLGATAPPGGIFVTLTPSNVGIVACAPQTINIAQGQSSGQFSCTATGTGTAALTGLAQGYRAASASISIAAATLPPVGTARLYYLAPNGQDSNDGLSSSKPWLTPNHPLHCGDTIIAAAGTNYSAANFGTGKWGPVSCPASNNVAWLSCATFDACRISVTSGTLDGMTVSASYWGVQGWEVSNTAGGTLGGNCFNAVPPDSAATIHHIIFANNVANTCPLDGFAMGPYGTAGVDYWAAVGNVAYHAGVSNVYCGSGISAYEPVAADTAPGTHLYVAGNFSFANTNPAGCYDGNGIIFDTFDGDQTSMPFAYAQQGLIENNVTVANGAIGIRIENNDAGNGSAHARIIARQNTMGGNNTAVNQYGNPSCSELQLYRTVSTEVYLNLAVTNQAGCYGDDQMPDYAYAAFYVDATNSIHGNLAWSATGSYMQTANANGFGFAADNALGNDPLLAHPAMLEPPRCTGTLNTAACSAGIISSFKPVSASAGSYGYQVPRDTPTYDPLFPQWLCNVKLPSGLITMGCTNATSTP